MPQLQPDNDNDNDYHNNDNDNDNQLFNTFPLLLLALPHPNLLEAAQTN